MTKSAASKRSHIAWFYLRLLTTFVVLSLHFGLMGSFIFIPSIMHLYNWCGILSSKIWSKYVTEIISHWWFNSKWFFKKSSNTTVSLWTVYSSCDARTHTHIHACVISSVITKHWVLSCELFSKKLNQANAARIRLQSRQCSLSDFQGRTQDLCAAAIIPFLKSSSYICMLVNDRHSEREKTVDCSWRFESNDVYDYSGPA